MSGVAAGMSGGGRPPPSSTTARWRRHQDDSDRDSRQHGNDVPYQFLRRRSGRRRHPPLHRRAAGRHEEGSAQGQTRHRHPERGQGDCARHAPRSSCARGCRFSPMQPVILTKVACAVERRHSLAGANPARYLSLQPVAIGAGDGGNDIIRSTPTEGPPWVVQRTCGPQRE